MKTIRVKLEKQPCIQCGGEPAPTFKIEGAYYRRCMKCMCPPESRRPEHPDPARDAERILCAVGGKFGVHAREILDEETLASLEVGDIVRIETPDGKAADYRFSEQDDRPPIDRYWDRLIEMMPAWGPGLLGLRLMDSRGEITESSFACECSGRGPCWKCRYGISDALQEPAA